MSGKNPESTKKLIVDTAVLLFTKKGYDNTSIQDIINNLGGLSKGAIYHHFESKEDIFNAVIESIERESMLFFSKIREDKSLNGFQKMRKYLQSAKDSQSNKVIASLVRKLMRDAKFVKNYISNIFENIVPQFITPTIMQGVQDGSIVTNYPNELGEVLITLVNFWLNPMINSTILKLTDEEVKRKFTYLEEILKGLGLDLFDEETSQSFFAITKLYENS